MDPAKPKDILALCKRLVLHAKRLGLGRGVLEGGVGVSISFGLDRIGFRRNRHFLLLFGFHRFQAVLAARRSCCWVTLSLMAAMYDWEKEKLRMSMSMLMTCAP